MSNVLLILSSLENGTIARSVVDIALLLKSKNIDVSVVSAGGKMVKILKRENIHHYQFPINSNDIFLIRKSLNKIAELVKKGKFDLVHTFTPQAALYGYKLSKLLNIYHITSITKLYKKTYIPFKNTGINYMLKANHIIVPSNYMATYLENNYKVNHDKITIVPTWIDTDIFDPNNINPERIIAAAQELRIPEDHFVIATSSKLKNLNENLSILLNIIKLQTLTKQKIRCLIISNSYNNKYKPKFENLIKKHNAEHLIHIIDEQIDLPAALMLSGVYININLNPKASMTNILEAQSLGKPVIANNVGAAAEYMLHNISRLYDENNMNDLVQHLLWTVNLSKEERTDISKKLNSYIKSNFSKNINPDKIIDVYALTNSKGN